jgi:hypothetical protein
MDYAVIRSNLNIVENVIVWDGATPWTPPSECYTIPVGNSGAGIGWSYIDGRFVAPA